ncbi:hypothetical protein ABL78_2515 [Leptomonas seymouri]|uniref:Uncharacterized protein n=1 Tax=Leptomonas seymouri TaxID=5684 RepID=A0A0N0P751_LEPSE|nr:hypothetical protein ABL78_2515 [Leptomonas seymouri]|eukprot:KPI88396.1 hypothetical protein ABL78_2515 [Leptomonas seymouri]
MSTIPTYHGCFTLLYGDPEVREQQQYLQPLYGLTAEDDPPITRHSRESSQDESISSAGSSPTSAEDTHDDVLHMQRISIPGEPAVRRHKHPRIPCGLNPESTSVEEEDEENRSGGRDRVSAQQRGTSREGETADATTAAAVARPPRKINYVDLGLYPDLCTGVVGPQPVFGGVAVRSEAQVAHEPSPSPMKPYLFNSSGVPLLSSVVDPDALHRLQEARKPYPVPQSRSGHVLLPCPARGTLILYGGLGDYPFNDVWEYCTTTGRWTKLTCVPAVDSAGDGEVAVQQEGREDLIGRDEAAVAGIAEVRTPEATAPSPHSRPSRQRHQQRQRPSATRLERDEGDDTIAPIPNESLAAFIARLRAHNRNAAAPSDDSSTQSSSEVSGATEDVDELNEEEATLPVHAAPRNANMPPPAYGQSASLYVDEGGDTCMAILGGITVGDACVHGFFSLNLVTLTWRRLETTMRMKDVWGATAQTLYTPRRYTRPSVSTNGDSTSRDSNAEEEQVVVLFGGMTAIGEVIEPTTHILHLDHPLTADEISANAAMLLTSIDYDTTENARVMRRVLREEDAEAQAQDGTPTDDSQTVSLEERCARWRVAHADQLVRWRQRALRSLEGKYWAETIPSTSALHGRRRPTSAAFNRHFMFIFGGRDDLYFYNDLWCLNIVTRTWVQVRDGIPAHLMRRFLENPHNPRFGMLLNERGAQLRRRTVAAVEAKLAHNANSTMNNMIRSRDIHYALYSSSVNSTARARTGACMVVDVQRECLYLYGGFAYTGQQHLTFFDLHAYYVKENVWRRVSICQSRLWDAALDSAQAAVRFLEPCEEARPYPRHARPSGRPPNDAHRHASTPSASLCHAASSSSLPLTLMGYATRHFGSKTKDVQASVSSVCPPDRPPAPLIVRRGQRGSYNDYRNLEDAVDGASSPLPPDANPADCFHLPTFIPEARTMAAMVGDPRHPGTRFFLHGGRSGEEACGDLFELRIGVSRTVDVEYAKTQRIARLEAQTAAANRASTSPSFPSGRSSTNNNSIASNISQIPPPPPPSALGDPNFVTAASTAAVVATSAAAASGSHSDVNRLQLRSRRQLQRQLISAALEMQEEFEDAPAAHAMTIAETAPLPRHSLRDKAALWLRDGLAAADPKSLMFAELRNGRAVVNLRTHIHYSSRLSLLPNGVGGVAVAAGSAVGQTTLSASARRGGYGSLRHSTSSTSVPAAQQQQMDSLDGHLKRSALFLENLIYDVLLSKPISDNNSSNNGGEGMMSPCTHSAALTPPPESYSTFLSCPLAGSSPGTSPVSTAPHVQIVSRAQYATPRTPQPLSASTGAPQQRQNTLSPLQPELSSAHTQEYHTPSPALTRHSSSSFCSCNSSGLQPPATGNEYGYHTLLRILFHCEPFYKTLGASEKKQ